ncbi:TetR/AcrR family transcriptional regulator [Pseudofrankia inefficax]|uniref:Regulatory protein TetR n=1 Tax=Pseudofrankia inefficax (strain DSM 45817 / CECT 9037 / DDB 130130 / EuI1c) TaxID=298654 RepID=E3IV36_PSEI1|nr:TetR/AcrR family transcriptional regulator [Pseudofrankia inefficax]ADP80056.1 regulatory protein TetR [Pseudofrankia inefficax]
MASGTVRDEEPRSRRIRRDFLASRRDLLEAAERLLAKQGGRFSLTDLAAEAGVSTATAYRHFPDVPTALDAYYTQLVELLVTRMEAVPPGPDALRRFVAVCEVWVREAVGWGPAVVHVRSSRGFLQRLRAEDPVIGRLFDALAPMLAKLADAGFIPPTPADYGVLLWVTVFDERVVVDLHDSLGWPAARIATELTGSILRALGRPAGATG